MAQYYYHFARYFELIPKVILFQAEENLSYIMSSLQCLKKSPFLRVWTEAVRGMVFLSAQKLSIIVWI